MDVVETALLDAGVDHERIHIERFTAPTAHAPTSDPAPADDVSTPTEVTITLGSQTKTIAQRGRLTILESARWSGLSAPSSCESGHCATCMARLVEGDVDMAANDVLTEDEVSEGWILTCQSVPVSPAVRVVYET
jgi:ferredoxin